MAASLLNIGKSGLLAAQAGLSTTGHNIANANVAGYSRQVVVQAASAGQNYGYGFVGSGTQVAEIKRYSDEFLNHQVRTAQASTSAFESYLTQISQVDNLLADTTSGLSPALQDFFKGVQNVASGASLAARDALLAGANSLAARFQGMNGRLQEIREGVNSQITTSVTLINSYAGQIAQLNQDISLFSNEAHLQPNDLLDKRDQLVAELNMQVKASVVKGDNNSLTISIGSGQPIVVGNKAFELAATSSPTDPMRTSVGIVTGNKVTTLPENALSGGQLGGLLEFRANALDRIQNSLGRIAIGLAESFNAQHMLGQDSAGELGTKFFNVAAAEVSANRYNHPSSTTLVTAVVSDVSKLSQSDYRLDYNGTDFVVTRLSDNQPTTITSSPQTIDGIDFNVSGSAAAGDVFLIRPTINGAGGFSVALTDRAKIAVAAPISTDTPLSNKGSGKISEGSVDSNYLTPGNQLPPAVTLQYASGTPATMAGFPASQPVKMIESDGTETDFGAGAPVEFKAGATYSFGGINVAFTGAPADGDTFTIDKNQNGVGDNRNARLLGGLQAKNTLDGGTATYQSAYAEMVSFVGNKTREVQVNGQAGQALLTQARQAQQNVSGVNLDEEATNLLKYQQAYQAAGKVMQIASTLFDTLLSLGN
jgi:flagellar hook-associated protein 1 FlgK